MKVSTVFFAALLAAASVVANDPGGSAVPSPSPSQTETPTQTPTPTPTPTSTISATVSPSTSYSVTPSAYAEVPAADFTVSVSDSSDDIQVVLDTAVDGQTVEFSNGVYQLDKMLNVSSSINIRCPTGDCTFNCTTNLYCIEITGAWTNQDTSIDTEYFSGINVTSLNFGGQTCSLIEPIALNATADVSQVMPSVENGNLVITQYYDAVMNRRLTDVHIGTCKYSEDLTNAGEVADPIVAPKLRLTVLCTYELIVAVKFSRASECADSYFEDLTWTGFNTKLRYEFVEYVTMFNETHDLRSPATRRLSTQVHLTTRFNTVENITSVVTANYPRADVEAKIVLVDIGSEDGYNNSRITLETDTPTPYTFPGQLTGTVTVVSPNTIIPTDYTVSDACTNTVIGSLCIQYFDFRAEACDLTGQYSFQPLMLTCAAGSEDTTCPLIAGQIEPVEISFNLETNNFCDVEDILLEDLFDISIERLSNLTAAGEVLDYADANYTLGDMLYQAIVLDTTNTGGLGISDAAVVQVLRESDGDCTLVGSWGNYMKNYNDGNGPVGLNQTFVAAGATTTSNAELQPAHITLENMVVVAMACATADRSKNQVNHTYTVRVDYTDGFDNGVNPNTTTGSPFPARRRSIRRESGEMSVASNVGFSAPPSEVERAILADITGRLPSVEAANGSDNTLIMGVAFSVILLLVVCCFCCCACVFAGVIHQNRKKAERLEKEVLAQHNSQISGFDANSGMSLKV